MARPPAYSAEQIYTAVDEAKALITERGYSVRKATAAVAEQYRVDPTTVGRWAQSVGQPLAVLQRCKSQTEAAAKATVAYGIERRPALSDRLFATLEALLDTVSEPAELRQLALTYETLTDKRREEEGRGNPADDEPDATALDPESEIALARARMRGAHPPAG